MTGERLKRFWTSDYPLICFKTDSDKLNVVNLAIKDLPMKEIDLPEDYDFIAFVEGAQETHDAKINCLLRSQHGQIIIRVYSYEKPFEIGDEDFESDCFEGWREDDCTFTLSEPL